MNIGAFIATGFMGAFVGFVIGLIMAWNASEKLPTSRVCKNCNNWQLAGRDRGICGHSTARYKQQYLMSSDTCGHFDFTEELKTEQLKKGLEKSFK